MEKVYIFHNGKWRALSESSSYTINDSPPDEKGNFQITLGELEGINIDKIELVDNINTEGTAIGVKNEVDKSGSIAIGTENKTTGKNSSSLGFKNNSIGNNSFSVGRNNYAFNEGSIALGFSNTVSSEDSTALGGMNNISGDRNISLGFSNTGTQAKNTFTIGVRNLTKNEDTITIGFNNKHYANETIALGQGNSLYGIRSIAIGENNSTQLGSVDSIVIGSHPKTNAKLAVALGYYAEANGELSRSLGHRTVTDGEYSVAFGRENKSEGAYALTHGFKNEARKDHGLALGESNISGYEHAITLGQNNMNLAKHSIVIGQGLQNRINYAHVIGQFNELEDVTPSTEPTQDNNVWVVGNGMNDTERNTVARIQHDGQMFIDGRYRSKGADYAEMFEWEDGNPDNEDRVGLAVSLVGDKIKLADKGEKVIGIVSATPSVVGNDPDKWKNKWETDKFGRIIYENYIDKRGREQIKPKINPDWNNKEVFIPRDKRPEWDAIGLLGQLLVLDDGSCKVGEYATIDENGTLTHSKEETNILVLKRKDKDLIKILFK